MPSEKMVFNCPQTFLFLLCKNYKGVTIFKAYFSIHKKDIYFQSDDVSLSLNPQCLLESFFFFLIFSHPHFLILLEFSFLLRSFHLYFGVFSHVNLYNGKYCSVWIERMEN